ncbi:MAG: hypothetical protein FIB03_16160 [Anaerolineae bacterium]|nr:hypothetical protein [Anaerolineae bacterium]
MKRNPAIVLFGLALLVACTSPGAMPPTPTQPVDVISTFISTQTPSLLTTTPGAFSTLPALTSTPAPVSSDICTDSRVTALLDSLKTSVLTSNGETLSSLVSPARGVDVRYLRNGTVVTYTAEQAKFLFETTYEVNWGAEPGSGQDKVGSFHDVIVPDLVEVFNQPSYALHCNELKHGGATYELEWPYQGGFYSVYFPGTEQNGFLDWHTWVVGIEYVNGKPYIYALMQFFWEP